MPCTGSESSKAPSLRLEHRYSALLKSLLVCVATSCSYVPPPCFPRAALPLPSEVAARYALPCTPQLTTLTKLPGDSALAGELTCGSETIRFHLLQHADQQRPVVLLVPILSGGEDLMRSIARRVVQRGYHAAWCERAGSAMRVPQRSPELEQLFVRTVVQQRVLLAFLRDTAILRPRAFFALGVSMGGIISTVLTAVEPDLDGTAICLAGADLPNIVLDSDESRVVRWRNWRMADGGIGANGLRQELQRELLSDPGRLGPFVDTNSVLLVHATFDEVIRPPHQDLLWESLGRPRRFLLPLGHSSSAMAIDSIIATATRFFHERELLAEPLATRR
ncbi:MAG: hypothetical protein EXS02_12530 [Planctomycetes bacterium]|nr:hypothetical protein [Planctomycetota bacterium]